MNRDVLDRYCERGILALVLAILVIGPLALGAVRGLEFSVIQALTGMVGLLWAARLWLSRRPQLLWAPICWAVLAFALYAVARYFTADVEYVARQELLRVLVYALLFFAILNNLHRQESTTIISFTIIFLALAIAAYGVYQYLAQSDRVWTFLKPYHHRGSGTYICPNHFAGFLEMLLPLALAYAMAGRLKPVTRALLSYAAVVLLAGIAVSISRAAWVATAVALMLFVTALMFRRQYRLPGLVLLVLVLGAGGLFLKKSTLSQQRLNELVTNQGTLNNDFRLPVWTPAFQMWRDNAWWGVGPAHFKVRFPAYRPETVQRAPEYVHNDYLNTLTDWGIAGAILVTSAWVLLGVGVFQVWRSRRLAPADLGTKTTSNKYAFVIGASLGLVAILVHSLVDFNMHIPANAIVAVTLMALLTAHLRFSTERFWVRPELGIKLLATVAILATVVYLVPQAWRLASESVWLNRAAVVKSHPARHIELLKRAAAAEPNNPNTAYDLGEAYRRLSLEGGQFYEGMQGVDYRTLAGESRTWFNQGMTLNPYEYRNYSGYGWCLDWLDQGAEAASYFDRAEQLDPNNYFNMNCIGLHYVQNGDFAAARPWFERSLRLESQDNDIARNYLNIIQSRLLDAATNQTASLLGNHRF